ncbi:matrix metalloproteinase-25-like [Amphibalanus amphitrite]|uniref:matrix metalloproteinase-25-like n=1 Tax=Amphibalanus amphitrite TaxID=1232801 RepID=UPI001C908009|nr:matrix metalloproteinase-25-like [Amphibalanus amphitrite]
MYFFKGSQYWRFDSELETTGRPGVSDKYPQPISIWQGIPNNIDSVLIYENKRTYFFKGDSYYRFNDAAFSVDASYPRSTAEYWFGCTGQISNLVTPSSDNRQTTAEMTKVPGNRLRFSPRNFPFSASDGVRRLSAEDRRLRRRRSSAQPAAAAAELSRAGCCALLRRLISGLLLVRKCSLPGAYQRL